MNRYIINSSTLAEIGDTVRHKTGISESIPVPEISKHIEKVYEAGKNSMVDESKLLPTTVSGSYISLDDVSEVPHEISCKISGVDNPETVKVTRTGPNLFDCANSPRVESNEGNDNAIIVGRMENSITVQKTNNDVWEFAEFILPEGLEGETITISADWTCSGENTGFIRVNWNNQLEATNIIAQSQISGVACSGVVTKKPDGASWLSFYLYGGKSGSTGDKVYYKNIMVNIGEKAFAYEPYNGQTLTPASDGTVDGMTSVSPYMNIFSDTKGVNIEITYNQSWGMQETQERFCDIFKQEIINNSISFEQITLSKESITSIISALSNTATNQTVTFKKCTKELFTDDEWQTLISTKANWIISLV